MKSQIKTQQKAEYNETELGLLPEEWNVSRIDDLYYVKQGKQISARESKQGKMKKPFLRTSNLSEGKVDVSKIDYMYFTPDEFENLRLQRGDILVCEGGDIGRTALYNGELEECAYQNHLHRLRPKTENTNNEFFVYWMNHAINQRKIYVCDANRTTIPNLSGSRLKNFKILHPPLPEQRNISSVLSSIQEAKEETEAVISALKELKKSLMKHLFTYGPVSLEDVEKVELKETEIGKMPKEWKISTIGEVSEFTKKPKKFKIENNEEIPFIPMDCISKSNKTAEWHIKKYSKISSGTFVFKNDLIIAKITPCLENGKQAILRDIPKDFAYATTEVWALHPKDKKANVEYLYEFLKIPEVRKELAEKMEGSTGRQRLPRHVLENFKIPLPPISVQEQVASILSSVDAKIEVEQNKANALNELFNSMLRDLMTAKVRVKDLVMA